MKKFTLMLAGLGIAAAAVPASAIAAPAPGYASFQGGWQSINGRQARLEDRINQGIRSGALSRSEAMRLRNEFRQLARLEARYRATGGLNVRERMDLDHRFDALSARVRYQKHDNEGRGGRRW
jgi:hypothetical protein